MNQARFRQLIEGFCELCGLPEPQRILDGGPVAVGDYRLLADLHDPYSTRAGRLCPNPVACSNA
jgi:hypothetical protein